MRLRPGDLRHFRSIVRKRRHWDNAALVVLAAQLARAMRDFQRESKQLDAEGTMLTPRRANPRGRIVATLGRRIVAMRVALAIGD